MLTHARLKELLRYDPTTGVFTWLVRTGNRVKAGDIAGSLTSNGYWKIKINGRQYLAHRLAWLWTAGEWPANHIDHIDGNPLNNRIENLRDVTVSINVQNLKRAQSDNKTGFLGVYQFRNRFRASIGIGGGHTHLGTFATPELAHAAYLAAKRQHHPGNSL